MTGYVGPGVHPTNSPEGFKQHILVFVTEFQPSVSPEELRITPLVLKSAVPIYTLEI